MNSVGLYYCLLFTCFYSVVKTLSLGDKSSKVKEIHQSAKRDNNSIKMFLRHELQLQPAILRKIIGTNNVEVTPITSKNRVKRQSGAGKFVEAAKMPQIKLVRLFLQMFKNIWDDAYIGGSHPLHHNVPKAIVELYKEKIVEFFIPDIEESKGN